jgi:hypothetical protein
MAARPLVAAAVRHTCQRGAMLVTDAPVNAILHALVEVGYANVSQALLIYSPQAPFYSCH